MNRKILFGILVISVFVLGTSTVALAISRNDPALNTRFVVELDGIVCQSFTSIEGLGSELEVVEYRDGMDPEKVRLIAGSTYSGPITLRRGVTDSQELWEWFKSNRDSFPDRRNMAIILLDKQGYPQSRWEFWECWPSAYYVEPLESSPGNVAYEVLVIQYEHMNRVTA